MRDLRDILETREPKRKETEEKRLCNTLKVRTNFALSNSSGGGETSELRTLLKDSLQMLARYEPQRVSAETYQDLKDRCTAKNEDHPASDKHYAPFSHLTACPPISRAEE